MKILLVEDNQKLSRSLKSLLESESYVVDAALDGQTGYDKASTEEYDLIILDIGLPVMDGCELGRLLRENGNQTQILALTAKDSLKDKIKCFDSGADQYLSKPFEVEELLARVRSLLRRAAGKPNTDYVCDNLKLDTIGRVVTLSGKEITLTAKEYRLLEYLMAHMGQILSKQKIIDHVWDSEIDSFTNIVDVYMGYLRKKIDIKKPKGKSFIKTVRGLGYKIG